ncbi:MAG: DeoR/GlpR family DNA-binding transcription regulator [Thermaceae bacterium]|nr:DeoR/GlpR family DNA-binding transcription regulator [Thermaceae bacterium]
MLPDDRLRRILELVNRHGTLSNVAIAQAVSVSTMTVRRDLSLLERQGRLRRVHGGAQAIDEQDVDYSLRRERNLGAKQRIGAKAAEWIQDGETVYLDAGTTTMEVARALKARRLRNVRVVTHAVNIATELSGTPGLGLLQVGGELFLHNYSATGPLALETLRRFSFDRLFLGAQGVDPSAGLTNSSLLEAEVKQAAIDASRWVCLVCDASKWGRVTFAPCGDLRDLDLFITDSRLPQEARAKLAELGLEVITVPWPGNPTHD